MDNKDRDLLIKLGTQFDDFKEYTKERFNKIESMLNTFNEMGEDIATMKVQIKENTRMRIWMYAALISGIGSLAITVITKWL